MSLLIMFIGEWLELTFDLMHQLPACLSPAYYMRIVSLVYHECLAAIDNSKVTELQEIDISTP